MGSGGVRKEALRTPQGVRWLAAQGDLAGPPRRPQGVRPWLCRRALRDPQGALLESFSCPFFGYFSDSGRTPRGLPTDAHRKSSTAPQHVGQGHAQDVSRTPPGGAACSRASQCYTCFFSVQVALTTTVFDQAALVADSRVESNVRIAPGVGKWGPGGVRQLVSHIICEYSTKRCTGWSGLHDACCMCC